MVIVEAIVIFLSTELIKMCILMIIIIHKNRLNLVSRDLFSEPYEYLYEYGKATMFALLTGLLYHQYSTIRLV